MKFWKEYTMNNFSPNILKTYETCLKKFYYQHIEKISMPSSASAFEKGKKIHALANYFLRGVNISRIETALNDEEKILWNLLLDNSFYQKEYFKSEFTLSCKIEDYWIGGRIDAIVRDDNKYYILDYKTGSIPKNPEYDYQTMVYLLCLDLYLKNYDSLAFVYIDLKNKQNHVIEFNETLKQEYEKRIIKACSTITSDTIYNCHTQNCKYCEYSKLCNCEDLNEQYL